MKMLVVYLDLLGFRDHLSESSNDALISLENYKTIFSEKNNEIDWIPKEKELRKPARLRSIDTFDYFLPFSDSIVIASSQSQEADVFIRQVANFLYEVFTFNSTSFDPTTMLMNGRRNSLEAEKVNIVFDAAGRATISKEKCLNYPVLFRGGLAYGDVVPLPMQSRVNKEKQSAIILAGQGVVDAVKLEESKIKGPRIIFGEEVYAMLSSKNQLRFCRKVPETSHSAYYEILWPNSSFFDSEFINPNYTEITDLYGKAVTLWRHYNHKECGIHYFKFSELILSSAMMGAKACGQDTDMQEHLRKLVDDNSLSGKYNALSCKARG